MLVIASVISVVASHKHIVLGKATQDVFILVVAWSHSAIENTALIIDSIINAADYIIDHMQKLLWRIDESILFDIVALKQFIYI